MSRYKLAFAVANYFEFGGMQRTLLRIARECARRGHEVHFFAGKWEGERPPELRVHLLESRALTNHGRYRRFGLRLASAVADAGFDCVIGSNKGPCLDVYYGGDPCYAARVDEQRGRFYKLLPRYRALIALEREVFGKHKGTEILLIAHQEREKFIHYYGTEPARFHMLPAGIDKERLTREAPSAGVRAELRNRLGVQPGDYLLLNVGSRFRTKGVDRAIIALASLPGALRARSRLIVVGGDRPQPFLKLAKACGVADRVSFAGAQRDIAVHYHAADLLIHPAYTENTGTTLLEAMICGLPVLVTENCGFAFHVRNARAGLVCPSPFRQQELNQLLATMLTAGRHAEWGENGRAYCERTDLYSLIEKAADIVIERAARNAGK